MKNAGSAYRMGDIILESSESERDLRDIMDNCLNMSSQLNVVVKRANATLGCIKKKERGGGDLAYVQSW